MLFILLFVLREISWERVSFVRNGSFFVFQYVVLWLLFCGFNEICSQLFPHGITVFLYYQLKKVFGYY